MQMKIKSILVLSLLLLVSLTTVVSAEEQKINIIYVGWMPDPALELASQNGFFAEDINYIYIPSYNTTTWAGPSDELIEAANSGLLGEQDIIFCDMLSAAVFEPMNTSFSQAHDAGISLIDINSINTPSYFDYISDGTDDDMICNLYNNMGTATETERQSAEYLIKYLAQKYGNHPEITDEWDKIRVLCIAWTPNTALQMASETNKHRDVIEYTYIPSYNTTTWAGPSDELIEAGNSGILNDQDVIFCDMLASSIYEPMEDAFVNASENGAVFADIRSVDSPEYFDHVYSGSEDNELCNLYNAMGTVTEEQIESSKDLLIFLASEYGERPDITDDWNKVNILYIAWTPSTALQLASEMSEHTDDIKFTYIPSYNTTTWAGPSDELIEVGDNMFLEKQDVIFCDMLSASIYDPLNTSFYAAQESGVSLVDIRSINTPDYFDYVSNGSIDDTICNYYNSMGTETDDEQQNAQSLLEYLATEYGNREEITDTWDNKIKVMYIAWTPSQALELASQNNMHNDEIEYTYIPSYNTTTWAGPSDELLEIADSGLLDEQDVIFCDMLSANIYDPLNDSLISAKDNGVSFVDIRSLNTPDYFDYVSNGSIDDPICNYYNSMGIDSEVERKNAENLLIYLAKEYGTHSEITDNWITIKVMYIAWAPSDSLATASKTNPYSQNIEYTYIASYNTTTWTGPSDDLLAAGEGGLLEEQDVIFCDMLASSIFEPIDQFLKNAQDNGTVLVDIRSVDTPDYFDHVYEGSENNTLCNYYNNMGTATGAQLNNAENLLIYLAKELGVNPELTDDWEYAILGPITLPDIGLYHPDYEGKYFESTDDYLTWYAEDIGTHKVYDPSKPTIGMWMHRSDIKDGHTEVVDALLRDIESKDCNVILGFDTFDEIVEYYCDENNQSLIQSVISLKSFRLNYFDNEKGLRELEELDVPVLRGIVVESTNAYDPADENRGIPNGQVVRKTIGPNVDGIFEYIVVGDSIYDPDTLTSEFTPRDAQVDWIVNRSINWAELKLNENKDKKVAVIYYNYPSGKDNIGASYLDTISSMRLMLNKMNESEFSVTGIPENNSQLLEMIWAQGINAGSWAPGVMNEMVENKTEWGLQLIPMETYHQWFEEEIPEELKDQVIQEWGEPWSEDLPQNKSLMMWENDIGEKYLVIPTVQFGNVWLMPQPARGFLQNDDALYHSSLVPPPHQYIAFYLWLNNDWDADAIIHFGTHGTHEWLPGQAYGMNRSAEWAPVLLQDLPNIYPYIVANVGEGLTAEYRGNALIIDHMTPTLERSGTYGELANMSRFIQEYYGPEMSLQTKQAYQMAIIDEMVTSGVDVDLEVNATELYLYSETQFDVFVKDILHEYLEDIEGENIPYGMHILGEVPSTNATGPYRDELSGMVRSMMGSYFEENITAAFYPLEEYTLGIPFNDTQVELLVWEVISNGTSPSDAQMMVYGEVNESLNIDLEFGLTCKQNLIDSAIEMDRVISALSSTFIPAGPGTDPIMNPNAVPTGRNFYGVNPELYPSEATWKLGKMLAQQLIDDYYQNHGEYPRKVSFSRFGVEFIRDHGTLEAEALYLMGVQPVWDRNGKVIGVELIPEEELLPDYDSSFAGRPRIDIVYTTAGMRDAFPDKLKMLDNAAKLANLAEAGNYPNYINISTQAIYTDLYASFLNSTGNETYSADMADTLSTMRCFAVRDGTYEIGVGNAIEASGTWENESEIGELYLDKMGYAYGSELWGYDSSDLLKGNLMNVDASVHSDSSNLYDTLDNDDFFQYFGGLNLATRYVSGKTPDMYVSDTRNPDEAEIVELGRYINVNIRSRYLNDKWIEGMKGSGYAGGRMMAEFVDNLWGWEVSNSELVDDKMWENVFNTYTTDEMKEFFNANNPGAYQSITGRMLEGVRKGYIDLPDDAVNKLVKDYMESVAENGATCCHHTCGNPSLDTFIQGNIPADFSQQMIDAYKNQMFEATLRKELQTQPSESTTTSSSSPSSSTGTELKINESGSGSANQTLEANGGAGMDMNTPVQDSTKSTPDNYVEGYEMTKEATATTSENSGFTATSSDIIASVFVLGAVGAMYVGFWRRRKM
ncbi:cobaltochelatase subunit CobN [uncultured Methanolobus sp.]|uniref:cobaltochelatase subunit CobN n=1 Tax=uncultured Methanolobus sp. TaxID=218300 RepID=UPI0029C6B85B|nr:cobaltochelatase subunit CobN [uncultured Methanolobus sp.]